MKRIFVICLFSFLVSYMVAQNMTDRAVMNDKLASKTDLDDWTIGPAIDDSVFLCPDRVRYDSRCLQIEGKDVFLLSGTMHYFRTPQPLWRDRLQKIKQMGFNCVETYAPWNWHEREMPSAPDDFSKVDLRELDDFLSLAEEVGLYAIVRPGPYICAEWSGGGFPQWLMQKRPTKTLHEVWLQSMDSTFIAWNDHWYQAVARVVAPHQLSRKPKGAFGVVLIQVENEFNRIKWFPRSEKRQYLEHMAQQLRKGGIDIPLITCWTDEARNVSSGPLNGIVDMVNSYPRWQIRKGFGRLINQQLKSQPGKPLISGELQGGWSSDLHSTLSWDIDGQTAAQTQNITLYALQRGFCALNYYMLVGGTNLDDWASRDQTASYDFAAAIGEDGTINERYYRLQSLAELIAQHGTQMARARIEDIPYESNDTLVELLVRRTTSGDRYLFVRTEDYTQPHAGTLTITLDGQARHLPYALEPFGSRVLYLPAKKLTAQVLALDDSVGQWWPRRVANTGRPPYPQLLSTLTVQTMADPLPSRWTKLPEGKTVDALGHYDRHFLYYKIRGKVNHGGLLTVPIVGKNKMNNTDADEVMALADGKSLVAEHRSDTTVCFNVPQGTRQLLLLYDPRGLHHHTNLAVERNWLIGPRCVWLDGKAMPLSFAATEKQRGVSLTEIKVKSEKLKEGISPLKWVTASFSLNHAPLTMHHKPLWLHIEQQGNGFVYVNGHCLGRCYDYGPQHDFYIPDSWLHHDDENHVAISLMPNGKTEASVTNISLMAATETPRTWAFDQPVEDIKKRIDQYVERHQSDPQWLLSRMAMYWKEGEHYTQCYISGEHWHHGEGNAPVPTLRLPGERTWNKNPRPQLADLLPYNETGDLAVRDAKTAKGITIPYTETGHSVRSINGEILQIAAEAAYVFHNTNDERYARLATDVFNQTLLGIYYMNPVINLTPGDTEGPGGWKEGGILGYYDYEQIHDDIGLRLATIYDYAREYILTHPTEAMQQTGKDTRRLVNEVMRRFIDLGMIRGGKTGNWNVNGWDMMFRPILVLEDNIYFEDGHGRQYFLHYLAEESTRHHNCIPDMLQLYDPITGLWPESPGYGFGTVLSILSWDQPLRQQGIDLISKYDILRKAAVAIPVWSDYRGNAICFGDYRGGRIGKESPVVKAGWTASSYSPFHRMVVLKNFEDPSFPMMACLYGGRKGSHLSVNGLALQLYGYGYALSPDASAYESYWSEDYHYHQSVEGANTILQGYQEGPVQLSAMIPAIDTTKVFAVDIEPGSPVRMATMTAGEKQRIVVLVKGSKGLGYYLDIFDPGMANTDYVMHTVGREVVLFPNDNDGTCQALWTVDDSIRVRLWVSGGTNRKYTTRMNPSSYGEMQLTPGGVSTNGQPTPTFYAHQDGNLRYANVYEVYCEGRPAIKSVKWQYRKGQPLAMIVILSDGTQDIVSLNPCLSILRKENNNKKIKLL